MPSTRQLLVHQDDIGMCHGANTAFIELSALGAVDAGSVMVPCPWFAEIADVAAATPALDVGVHLTLNSEKHSYKWGPLTRQPASSGLVDGSGYFWPDVASTRRNVVADAADEELRAQIDLALARGIDVTHLDAHMGAVFAPELCDVYALLGRDYSLPILLTARLDDYSARNHLDGAESGAYHAMVDRERAHGAMIFDRVLETDWSRPPTRPAEIVYSDLFGGIGPGRTFVAMHFNAPGELESIEPSSAHVRIGEYELFKDADWRAWLDGLGFERIGFRAARDAMRGADAGR